MTDFPFDEATPQDLYVGRLINELLKSGFEIRVRHAFTDISGPSNTLSFTATKDHSIYSARDEHKKEIDLMKNPLSIANYHAEDIEHHHNRALREKAREAYSVRQKPVFMGVDLGGENPERVVIDPRIHPHDGTIAGIEAKQCMIEEMDMVDISKCPKCGGFADNGFDRCYPPNPYNCTKCEEK